MKKLTTALNTLLVCASLCAPLQATTQASLPASLVNSHNTLAPMLKQVLPSVVNIVSVGHDNTPNREVPTHPHRPNAIPPQENDSPLDNFVSIGSGVILNGAKGYIVTNAHVIRNAHTITVNLSDGRRFEAKVIGKDVASDVAVIQIHADNLKQIQLANSSKLQVGDFVAAIGNPFGLNQTVTSGIVSALGRSSLRLEGKSNFENFIQTDAPINPGNSGGALINLKGQLEGINTAIIAKDGGSLGIGFAIPVNMIKEITHQLIEYGAMHRGRVGMIVQQVSPELAKLFDVKAGKGTVITQVNPNTPAAKAGLKVGDIILTVNGNVAKNPALVHNTIGLLRAGSSVSLKIERAGRIEHISLRTAPIASLIQAAHASSRFLFGLSLRNFDQEIPHVGHVQGIEILHITPNSPAWNAYLMPGDVITDINRQPVRNIDALKRAVQRDQKQECLLRIIRGNGALYMVIKTLKA